MHPSSLENMMRCIEEFALPIMEPGKRYRVLDIGGGDVNGSYSSLFRNLPCDYQTADIDPDSGASIVLDDPYSLPLPDGSVDFVISGQMLEHCEFFWRSFEEMVRVLNPEGYLFLIAPSAGPIHRYPVDCYRFYPDAYSALAKYAGVRLESVWLDERGPWNDLTGVFTHRAGGPHPASRIKAALAPEWRFAGAVDVRAPEERMAGAFHYLDALKLAHSVFEPSTYLEIGVRKGASLKLAQGRAVGVDPEPEIADGLAPAVTLYPETSDAFFRRPDLADVLDGLEMAFIDGMHLFEYALRDFMQIERLMPPHGLIIVDDVSPNHAAQAERSRRTRVWSGDVWRLLDCLRKHRPDLIVQTVDASPTGLAFITGLDAANRVLWDRYNPIVRAYTMGEGREPGLDVLERKGASADLDTVAAWLGNLRRLKGERLGAIRTAFRPTVRTDA